MMNRSSVKLLYGIFLVIAPFTFASLPRTPLAAIVKIAWALLLVYFLYPKTLVIIALLIHRKQGRPAYLKIMSLAYVSRRISTKDAVDYFFVLLKEGLIEKASEAIDYAETLASQNRNKKNGERNFSYVRSYRALLLWKQNRTEEAARLLLDLLDSDYKTTALYTNLGHFLLELGRYEEALNINIEAIEYDRSASALDNLGRTYYLLGDLERSRECYDELVEMNPLFPDAWFNNGQLLLKEGKKEKALEMFSRALECNFSFLNTMTPSDIERAIKQVG